MIKKKEEEERSEESRKKTKKRIPPYPLSAAFKKKKKEKIKDKASQEVDKNQRCLAKGFSSSTDPSQDNLI